MLPRRSVEVGRLVWYPAICLTDADIQGAIEAARLGEFSVTPLQLLGVILRSVLKKRITDEEVDRISTVYYDTIQRWWK